MNIVRVNPTVYLTKEELENAVQYWLSVVHNIEVNIKSLDIDEHGDAILCVEELVK